jgi:exosortase/archaeosortase family protein
MTRRRKAPHVPAGTPPSAGLRQWWRGKWPVIRFGLCFAILVAAYYAVAVTSGFDQVLFRILHWNAVASCALLNLFGQSCTITGTVISSAAFSENIRRGCDAVEPVWFFAAAVLSFLAPARLKLAGIVVGAALICAANIVRISSLFVIGTYYPRLFPAAHLEIWPALLIILASVLWVAWILWARRCSADEAV